MISSKIKYKPLIKELKFSTFSYNLNYPRYNKSRFREPYTYSNNGPPPIHGLLPINKPSGVGSTEVVRYFQQLLHCYYNNLPTEQVQLPLVIKEKKLAREENRLIKGFKIDLNQVKVGHGGTLDPLATGVLVIGIGNGTKQLEKYLTGPKGYKVIGKFGFTTNTMDSEGTINETFPFEHITKDMIMDHIPKFIGNYYQTPPAYSAVRVNGQKLYRYAAKGQIDLVEIPKRWVECKHINLSQFYQELNELNENESLFQLEVSTGKGFFIRSLVNDLAKSLNSGAYVTELCRTKQGEFNIDNSVKLEDCKDLVYLAKTARDGLFNRNY